MATSGHFPRRPTMQGLGHRVARQPTVGPLLPLPCVRFLVASARRGRRCPAGAHAVAVGAARRLHCDARPAVASQNSLRSLRSLRSDNCAESVYEARFARRPRLGLRLARSPQNDRPLRPPWATRPTAAPRGPSCASSRKKHQRVRKGAFGQIAARLWGAEKHRARGPARSANRQLTRRSCLSVVSAANEASSATGPRDRASQGSRRAAPTAPVKRCGLPGRAFAAPTCTRKAERSRSATGRRRSFAPRWYSLRRGWCIALWSR